MVRSSADYFNGCGILQSSATKETILIPVYFAHVESFGINNLECHGSIAGIWDIPNPCEIKGYGYILFFWMNLNQMKSRNTTITSQGSITALLIPVKSWSLHVLMATPKTDKNQKVEQCERG